MEKTATPSLPEPGVWTGMASANVLEPLRWKRAKTHRGSRHQHVMPHQEAGYTSAVVAINPEHAEYRCNRAGSIYVHTWRFSAPPVSVPNDWNASMSGRFSLTLRLGSEALWPSDRQGPVRIFILPGAPTILVRTTASSAKPESPTCWGFFRGIRLRTGHGDLGIRENSARFLRQSPFAEQAPPLWGRTGGWFLNAIGPFGFELCSAAKILEKNTGKISPDECPPRVGSAKLIGVTVG